MDEFRYTSLQRQGDDALRQLQQMSPHLGFSFDGVGENENPYEGLLVDGVEPDSPAGRAGLAHGDVMLECNSICTLSVSDLLSALKGILPGQTLSLVILRPSQEQEIELFPVLGAKGYTMEHVSSLYSLVQASLIEQAEQKGQLSLVDVFEIPPYRRRLLAFMEAQFCAESLNFLTAEQAYSRIPDNQHERRVYAGKLIAAEFIATDGEQVINIDDVTRKTILRRVKDAEKKSIETKVFTPSLFRDAARVVFKMIETDVFKRFVKTAEYRDMLEEFQTASDFSATNYNTGANQGSNSTSHNQATGMAAAALSPTSASSSASSLPSSSSNLHHSSSAAASSSSSSSSLPYAPSFSKRRKEHSFAVVALEDKYSELDNIASEFQRTSNCITDHGFLKKIKSAFRGHELVSWLVERQLAKQRPAAKAIAQRMLDAFIVRHVYEEMEFDDSDKLYTFINPAADGATLEEFRSKAAASNSSTHQGYLLLKGVHYNRMYLLLHREKRKLFFYRSHHATSCCILKLHLKGASMRIFSDNKDMDDSTLTTLATIFASSTSSSHKSKPLKLHDEPSTPPLPSSLPSSSSAFSPFSSTSSSSSSSSSSTATTSDEHSSTHRPPLLGKPLSINTNTGAKSKGAAGLSSREPSSAPPAADDDARPRSATPSLATASSSSSSSAASPTATSSSTSTTSSSSSLASLKREVLTYLQLEVPAHNRTLIFRIEGSTDRQEWLEEFGKAGVAIAK